MFRKSHLLIAAAVVLGSASVAAAQNSVPILGEDSQQASYGPRPGVAIPPAPQMAGKDGRFDPDQQNSYGPIGYSALAQVPSPVAPAAGGKDGRFDPDEQMGYAR